MECCGEPMQCVEYDSDDDLYLLRCEECLRHQWWENEDEVWK